MSEIVPGPAEDVGIESPTLWSAVTRPPLRGCRAGDPGCQRFGRMRFVAAFLRVELVR